jgi:hypothetical protein
MHPETAISTPARAPGLRPDDALTVYRRIVCDPRISHGAHRLWHYLRDRQNKSGKCWPEVRDIARDIHCKTHSLPGWTSQLETAGYLATRKTGQNHKLEFTIFYGDHKGGLPEWASRGKARTGDTATVSRSPKGQVATPKPATPRVAETGDISNAIGVIPKSEIKDESNKPPVVIKDLTPWLTDLMIDCREILGADEMKRCHKHWLGRAEIEPDRLRRVLADTARAAKDGEINTTAAKYAEHRWKEFAP